MSEKQETIVRRSIEEVWNKGKLDVVDQLFTNDFVSHDPVNQTRGLPAFKGVVTKYRSAFPDCRLDIDDIFSAGDKVVVRWQYSGTHKGQLEGIAPTGRPVNGTGITIHLLSGDRIREAYINWDALGLMQQLGVVTLPGKVMGARA
jgi:steroid delta-isomerase-like uncharacterized protein